MKKWNATQLKYLMAAVMVLDHIPHITGIVSPLWEGIFHAMTRCVGVWFAYMAMEGFIHTRNLKNYLIRLWSWALIMFAGNSLLNALFASKGVMVTNNIFFTLAIGVTMLWIGFPRKELDKKEKLWRRIGLAGLLIFGCLFTEGGITMLPFLLISYSCRNRKGLRNLLYAFLWAFLLVTSIQIYDTWHQTLEMMLFNSDWLFITVFPFTALYNGQRGKETSWSKYFFYIFYPAHLWIITVIAYLGK